MMVVLLFEVMMVMVLKVAALATTTTTTTMMMMNRKKPGEDDDDRYSDAGNGRPCINGEADVALLLVYLLITNLVFMLMSMIKSSQYSGIKYSVCLSGFEIDAMIDTLHVSHLS